MSEAAPVLIASAQCVIAVVAIPPQHMALAALTTRISRMSLYVSLLPTETKEWICDTMIIRPYIML